MFRSEYSSTITDADKIFFFFPKIIVQHIMLLQMNQLIVYGNCHWKKLISTVRTILGKHQCIWHAWIRKKVHTKQHKNWIFPLGVSSVRFPGICSHLLKKSLMKNFIFGAVLIFVLNACSEFMSSLFFIYIMSMITIIFWWWFNCLIFWKPVGLFTLPISRLLLIWQEHETLYAILYHHLCKLKIMSTPMEECYFYFARINTPLLGIIKALLLPSVLYKGLSFMAVGHNSVCFSTLALVTEGSHEAL